MNISVPTQQYATNTTQSLLDSSGNQNSSYIENHTTNKNLQGAPTFGKNINIIPTTEYVDNSLLESYNTVQNLLKISFQKINKVNLSINNNTNINSQSNLTTTTLTTNTFCTNKPKSISHTKTHAGKKIYKCIVCGKAFSRKYVLQRHIKTHTVKKFYKCTYTDCDKVYKRQFMLQKHIKTHTEEKSYKCLECSKVFSRKSTLTCHTITHTQEKPYKCTYTDCDKKFNSKSNLQRHMKIHTEEKAYKCTNKDCDKAFHQKVYLQKHIKTHTRYKPYKCTECKKKFGYKCTLKQHIQKFHPQKKY